MSPLKLHILLEVYALVSMKDAHYVTIDIKNRAGKNLAELEMNDLIVYNDGSVHEVKDSDIPYEVTVRGKAFVEAITNVPLPRKVVTWVFPPSPKT